MIKTENHRILFIAFSLQPRAFQYNYRGAGGGGGGGGGGKVNGHTLGLIVLYHRRVLYLRVVALQMAYCTYLFENSVAKI